MAAIRNGKKFCPKCKRYLSVNKFGNDVTNKDGLNVYCRECRRKINRVQNKKRKEPPVDMEKLFLIKKLVAMLKPYRVKGAEQC